jgi:hypothetical protein
LEDALALTEELDDPMTGFLIERVPDETRSSNFGLRVPSETAAKKAAPAPVRLRGCMEVHPDVGVAVMCEEYHNPQPP